MKPNWVETAVRSMKVSHQATPSGGNALPRRPAMLYRTQGSTPSASMRQQQSTVRRSRVQEKSPSMSVEVPKSRNPECGAIPVALIIQPLPRSRAVK
jgi:hypothetical protein